MDIKKLVWNGRFSVLGKFLIARMLYADGLNAIIVMGGIFAVGVFNLEIKELLKLSILMNITAFIGAFVGGVANDRFGSKIVIIFSLVGLIFSSIAILFIYSKSTFFLLAAVNGLFIGPVQSASRVVITSLLDKSNQGKGFGLFATSGKLTSFLGPLLVSTVTFITGSQRIGFSAAIILLLAGLIILLNIKRI
jgi:UMF1 family MFS transporter